jgi:hypothetical protein
MVMVLCAGSGFAQSRRKRPSSTSRTGAITDIRQVDFKNFTYEVQGERVTLRNGEHNLDWYLDRDFQTRRYRFAYGDLTGEGKEEAVVVLANNVAGGANAVLQYGLIYTIKNGQVIKLADFKGGDGPCSMEGEECSLMSVKVEGGLLIVDRAVPTANDANCCPTMYRSTKYRWNGSHLVEIGKTPLRRVPTK